MREVDYIYEDVNEFMDKLIAAIMEGRNVNAEVLQNE